MVLRDFCEGIGITSVKFHDLRATFITRMLSQGVPLAVVMAIVGHSSIKTTQAYLRLAGLELKGATDKLDIELPADTATGKVINVDFRVE
jgi:integrase